MVYRDIIFSGLVLRLEHCTFNWESKGLILANLLLEVHISVVISLTHSLDTNLKYRKLLVVIGHLVMIIDPA